MPLSAFLSIAFGKADVTITSVICRKRTFDCHSRQHPRLHDIAIGVGSITRAAVIRTEQGFRLMRIGIIAISFVILNLTNQATAHDMFADQDVLVADGLVVVHRPVVNKTANDKIEMAEPEIVILRSGEAVAVRRGSNIVMPEPMAHIPAIPHDGGAFASNVETSAFVAPFVAHRHIVHKVHRQAVVIRIGRMGVR